MKKFWKRVVTQVLPLMLLVCMLPMDAEALEKPNFTGHPWDGDQNFAELKYNASGHWYRCVYNDTYVAPNTDCAWHGSTAVEPHNGMCDGVCDTCGWSDPSGAKGDHTWGEAAECGFKTCGTCGATEGEHTYENGDCKTVLTCDCGVAHPENKKGDHAWGQAAECGVKTCGTCGATEGEHTYDNGNCQITLTCDCGAEHPENAKGDHNWAKPENVECDDYLPCLNDGCKETHPTDMGKIHSWIQGVSCQDDVNCSRCTETNGKGNVHEWAKPEDVACNKHLPCKYRCKDAYSDKMGTAHNWPKAEDVSCQDDVICQNDGCNEPNGKGTKHNYTSDDCQTKKTCVCKKTIDEYGPHKWSEDYECNADKHWNECELCETKNKKESHDFTCIETVKSTSSKRGYKLYQCKTCKYEYKEKLPRVGGISDGLDNVPKTGDNTGRALVSFTLMAGIAALAAVMLNKKRAAN